jgi:bacterioferritin (cytochrome b1)
MHQAQVHELLYQALETELGGIHVYQTALQCTVNAELTQEWHKYLEQTETHAQVLRELFATLKLNPDQETPGRQVVRHLGHALVTAMEMALAAGNPEAAQLVAAECVVTAETKDHLNWELLSEVAEALKGNAGKAVQAAYQQVEDEGHVADLHFPVSHRQPKLVAIDKQPNDNVMHLNRSGKADCLAG